MQFQREKICPKKVKKEQCIYVRAGARQQHQLQLNPSIIYVTHGNKISATALIQNCVKIKVHKKNCFFFCIITHKMKSANSEVQREQGYEIVILRIINDLPFVLDDSKNEKLNDSSKFRNWELIQGTTVGSAILGRHF